MKKHQLYCLEYAFKELRATCVRLCGVDEEYKKTSLMKTRNKSNGRLN